MKQDDDSADAVIQKQARTARHNVAYYQALKILKFPGYLHDFMSRPKHPFTIWHHPSDGSKKMQNVGMETRLLRIILKECRAQEVGLEAPYIRVLFVHIGSIGTLHMVPQFVERKQQLFLQIYTYGTHHTVQPVQWGVREIYALGGVITITPGALHEHLMATCRLVMMADMHVFWMAFITPTVLAYFLKEAYADDPLAAYDSGNFAHHDLLALITNGKLSLVRTPPVRPVEPDMVDTWVAWHWGTGFLCARDIIIQCLAAFSERYATAKADNLRTYLQDELETVVRAIMRQPVIMETYRRFIIITGKTDAQDDWTRGGMEWLTLDKFEFGDDNCTEDHMKEMRALL